MSPSQVSKVASNAVESDPAAIIGLACRVPGASNPSQLWNHIEAKRDVQRKMPENRFNVDKFFHPDGTNKGTTNARYGYFLDQDIGLFDAGFFNISGKEAEAMDPQQRILLEVVYEALEDAGITLDQINGTQASVYCGCFTNDYNVMTSRDEEYYPKYTVTGTGNSILSNRISYFYNLHGPSVTLDTACSSSLVAFHFGNQSLLSGESDLSIIVGTALHFDPHIFITMTDLGMLSTDGRCRAFDAKGSGYVRGEGVCAAILKRQSKARADGDNIRAIVRTTGVNHDGKKQGITLPSPEAQEALIRRCYREANLDPADTQYFEAHGTGTQAGDPRETKAIGKVFAPGREDPLYVGSVKTNVGHLEGASGLAGVIKTTLALQAGLIPPNMHFEDPNPNINFEDWKIRVPREMTPWPEPRNGIRRASINSFGYGGTNGHVILENYVEPEADKAKRIQQAAKSEKMVADRPYLLPLTSHTEKAGKLLNASLGSYLSERAEPVNPVDLAYSLGNRRTMHRYRSFAIGKDNETLIKSVTEPKPIAAWKSKGDKAPRIGFVFTGQGAQWFAMGRQLIEQSPLFRQTLERCDAILQSLPDRPDWSVVEELMRTKETSRLGETRFSQPICTAFQLAVLELLTAWGIKPSAVVGHSSGEMGAAYAAGILSFENTIVAAYYRGLYMSNSTVVEGASQAKGAMMAVGLTQKEAKQEIAAYNGKIAIAAVNSAASITLSGDEDAIIDLNNKLNERKVFARRLQVAQAFHSHHMFPLAPGYEKALNNHPGFKGQPPKCRMASSVTARVADHEKMGASYWTANMTGTVRFSEALTEILLDEFDEQNVDVLMEIGPHPALKGPAKQTVSALGLDLPYIASLTRGEPDFEGLLAAAGQLFVLGYPVDLTATASDHYLNSKNEVRAVMTGTKLRDLPSYSWDHARYWSDTRVIREFNQRKHRHHILGAPVPGSIATIPRWRGFLRQSELPWLADHVIQGKIIFPAAGYISMAVEAVARVDDGSQWAASFKSVSIKDMAIKSALTVSEKDAGTEVMLELQPAKTSAKSTSENWFDFAIYSYDEAGNCFEHCCGLIAVERGEAEPLGQFNAEASVKDTTRCMPAEKFYKNLDATGLGYGPTFRLLSGKMDSAPGFTVGNIDWKPEAVLTAPVHTSFIHPTVLDASFHPIFAAMEAQLGRPLEEPFVPTFLKSMKLSGSFGYICNNAQEFKVVTTAKLPGPRVSINGVKLCAGDDIMYQIDGLELTALGRESESEVGRSLFFTTEWKKAFDFLDVAPENVEEAVELFVHQHPAAKILHLTPSVEASQSVLDAIRGDVNNQRRRFETYLPVSTTGADFTALTTKWTNRIESDEAKENEYDLVIVGENVDPVSYVKEDGIVICHGVQLPTAAASALQKIYSGTNVSAWKKIGSKGAPKSPLTVVVSEKASARTETVYDMINSSYAGAVNKTTLRKLRQSGSHDNVIVLTSLDEYVLFDNTAEQEEDFQAVRELSISNKNIVWVLEGATMDAPKAEHALIFGLARTARSEQEGLRFVVLDLQVSSPENSIAARAVQVLDKRIAEDEITERDGVVYIPRVVAADELNSKIPGGFNCQPKLEKFGQDRRLALKIGTVGLLDTLVYDDDGLSSDDVLVEDQVEIEVKASAINFRDVAASLGIIDDYNLGDECAGLIARVGPDVKDLKVGDKVVGWMPGNGAHRKFVRTRARLCYKLGDISYAVAASLPLILTTAYYALVDVAQLKKGETVLIHSAMGGVGQMAIQLAQWIGAKPLVTVGSQSKRDLVKEKYGLSDDQIFSSRDLSFVDGVRQATEGKGVDVVLNSLAGKLLHATWDCIAPFGRFVEIGKRDIQENGRLEMEPFRRNVMFASVDLITMHNKNLDLGAKTFQKCCDLVHEGIIQPPYSVVEYSYADAGKAFRLIQMGKHTGKVVLVPSPDDMVIVRPKTYDTSKPLLDANKTILLVGGLGGLGRTLAEWLVRRGARNLAFLSRSGASNNEAKATVQWLQERDIDVQVYKGDITSYTDVASCVQAIGPKLGGVFQAAMVLQDVPLDRMSHKQWRACVGPKVQGTYNLHVATQNIPLDFFICFSSVSAVIGTKAQANYVAANNYIDALMAQRRQNGLAGTSMNCGMIVGVGAVSEDANLQAIMERSGYDAVNEQELLYQIEEAVLGNSTCTGVNMTRKELSWSEKPLFRNLYANHDFKSAGGNSEGGKSLTALLATAKTPEERNTVVTEAFVEKVAAVLGVSVEMIQASEPLSAYGLDSIVALEFRKWFMKSIAVEVPLFEVLGAKSIGGLVSKAVSRMADSAQQDQKAAATASTDKADADNSQAAATNATATEKALIATKRPANVPLSTFQERLWFVHNMSDDRTILNLSVILSLTGNPNIDTLRLTLEEVKRRNPSLRTAYTDGEDFAEQIIIDDCSIEIAQEDFSADPSQLQAYADKCRQTELDIESGEVMRASLVKLGEKKHAIVFVFHHISLDRGSSKNMAEQITSIYNAYANDGEGLDQVPAPRIDYIDFTLWHADKLQSTAIQEDVKYWVNKFAGATGTSKLLPFAKAERTGDSARALQHSNIDLRVLKRMKRICASREVTPFQFLLAAFRSFIYRYTEEEDLTILMIDGNRPHADLEETVGFFVNMIPLRCNENCDTTFDHVLEDVRNTTLDALKHSAVPFDKIVDVCKVEKRPDQFHLGQVVVNYQMHGKMPTYTTKDFTVDDIASHDVPTGCEMNLEAMEDPVDGLKLRFEYASSLYAAEDMARFLDNFVTYISSAVKDHLQPIAEIPMCGHKELEFQRKNFWATTFSENSWNNESVVESVFRFAGSPATAIVTSSGESVTYMALIEKAQRVAKALQEAGAEPGQYVGNYCRPSIDAIAGMLAILMSRCGYVNMDPDFAKERLSFMAKDSQADIILTDGACPADCFDGSKIINISEAAKNHEKAEPMTSQPQDPFYTIYTSGSTGKPKGVVLTQSNTQQMLSTLHKDYKFTSTDKFLHQSSISFDLSVVQIFSGLTAGATVCVAKAEARKDPFALAKFMETTGVTVTYFTPTQFGLLMEHNSKSLRACKDYRVAYFAGERLPVRVLKAFYDLKTPATAYNTWSPSELVVQTTIHKCEYPEDSAVAIPIGYPMDNCRHYITDSRMQILPVGFVGEICVGGAQVGAGYLNRPDANEKSFCNDPYASEEDRQRGWTRVFRTGDKGQFRRSDAQLEFCGRIAGDKQIKLRGYRIDLGEVEQRIYLESKDIGLIDISVIARVPAAETDSLIDERQLIAFVVPRAPLSTAAKQKAATEVHNRIKAHLNEYMLPNGYQFLDALPVTVGGKVDRMNLLSRELQLTYPNAAVAVEETKAAAPKTESTDSDAALKTVMKCFNEILRLPATNGVSPNSNFFEVGGQSILLLRLHSKLRRAFKSVPPLSTLIKVPTPANIAQLLVAKNPTFVAAAPAAPTAAPVKPKINWHEETALPLDRRYVIPYCAPKVDRHNVSTVLLTGADSFIGVHMLATLLESSDVATINLLGSTSKISHDIVMDLFTKYKLLGKNVSRTALQTRTKCLSGALNLPRLGLEDIEFVELGFKTQVIYNFGSEISLLKSYTALKPANVNAMFDLVELAGLGESRTEIHHLSTWSVPHLQSWVEGKQSVDTAEVAASHFTPLETEEHGYFKSRWASEMVMTNAADRGFPITIYRATAVTRSTVTGVPEPSTDFIRDMIGTMIDVGTTPNLNHFVGPSFAVDFIPVNAVVSSIYNISSHHELQKAGLSVYHLGSEEPLPLDDLPPIIDQIRGDNTKGTSASLKDWLQLVSSANEEKQLKWEVFNDYFGMGHNMFALDRTATKKALDIAGGSVPAPAVDAKFLANIYYSA